MKYRQIQYICCRKCSQNNDKRKKRGRFYKFKGEDQDGKVVKSTERDMVGGWESKNKKG